MQNTPTESHPAAATTPAGKLLARGRRILSRLGWLWKHIVEAAFRADSDHVFMLAAGIAFNIITSLVPTILLVLFALGYFLDSASIIHQLNEYATTFIVTQGNRTDILMNLKTQIAVVIQNRGIAGVIGFIGLLWSASALAASIRVSVNKVLRCREVRNYFIYKLYDIVAIMLIGLLVFVSIVTGPLLQLLLAASDHVGTVLHLVGIEGFLTDIVNFVITLLLFYVIFRYVPYQKQEQHIIWIGTLTSTALWELARYVFSFYLTEFGTLGRVYGAYAFFAAAALWIYFSALVFLIGAEVAYHIKQSRWNARRTFNRISREI
ncbi:MAG: YihY/virulence factor BrkB family protein [Candidatus Kapaibacterium sp.]